METFFDDFEVDKDAPGIELLHDYQRVFRFGATALTIATLLTLLGLLVGARRTARRVLCCSASAGSHCWLRRR